MAEPGDRFELRAARPAAVKFAGNYPELKGKVALVTGSTSSIGLGVAQELARQEADIVVTGLGDPGEIQRIVTDLQNRYGVKVAYFSADMRRPAQIKALVDHTVAAFGRIDILVNNAGIQHVDRLENFPQDKLEAVLDINQKAVALATQAALPHMQKQGWGRIINIASAHGLVASPNKSAYVMAKHGVVGLTKTVALENATNGITVNAVCPGYVRTPLVEKQIPDLMRQYNMSRDEVIQKYMLNRQPRGRFVEVEEVAASVAYLASDDAKSITGTTLAIDGGWTAQ